MQISKEDLQEFAGMANMLLELKDTEEVRSVLAAIPQLAAEAKPMLEGLNKFVTGQDIIAVQQIMEAGFTAEQAIALRVGRNPLPGIAKAVTKTHARRG